MRTTEEEVAQIQKTFARIGKAAGRAAPRILALGVAAEEQATIAHARILHRRGHSAKAVALLLQRFGPDGAELLWRNKGDGKETG